jgi:hypothetical protein
MEKTFIGGCICFTDERVDVYASRFQSLCLLWMGIYFVHACGTPDVPLILKVKRILQVQDKIIKIDSRIAYVLGKAEPE